jgi:hypothetical protein
MFENVTPEMSTPKPSVLTSLFTQTRIAIFAVAAVLVGMGAYAMHEGSVARNLAAQNAEVQTSLKNTNAEIEQLAARVNDLTAAKQAAEVKAQAQDMAHRRATKGMVRMADGRFKKIEGELDEQGRAIQSTQSDLASTRTDLASTRTELQGSIAHTHDELVALERKGERNYFEFDLDKAKRFTAEGPIGIRLKKSNVKHQYADLELFVDDVSLQKKHVNLMEPAVFYAADSETPVELVINGITKNHIHGYVSAPKYKRSELTAMGGAPSSQSAQTPRQRLNTPQ